MTIVSMPIDQNPGRDRKKRSCALLAESKDIKGVVAERDKVEVANKETGGQGATDTPCSAIHRVLQQAFGGNARKRRAASRVPCGFVCVAESRRVERQMLDEQKYRGGFLQEAAIHRWIEGRRIYRESRSEFRSEARDEMRKAVVKGLSSCRVRVN